MMITDAERALLERMGGAVVAVGDDGRVAFASRDALALVGWDNDLLGRPLTTIMPQRMHRRHAQGFERYVKTGESRLLGKTVRVPAKGQDGSEKMVDLTIRVFRRPDGSKLVAASLDQAAEGRPPANLVELEDELSRRLYKLV